MKRFMNLAGVALALALVAGCGDDSTGPGPGNNNPVASFSASPDRVPPGDNNQTIVTLDASASTDADGDALTYSWTAQSGTFEGGTGPNDEVVQVSFPGAAPYAVTLTVSDGRGGSDTATGTIGLGDPAPNQAPVAVIDASPGSVPAGDNHQTVVTLDASGSSDVDGDALSFSWTVPSGRFTGGTGPDDDIIRVTFPGAAPYRVTVVVTDGHGGEATAEFTVSLS